MVLITDSHCHLNLVDLTPYGGDVANVISEAGEYGVHQLLCVSIDLATADAVTELAKRFTNVFASVGIHPTHDAEAYVDVATLVRLAERDRVIAIGETGLDYYRTDRDTADWQRERFITHIDAARQSNKPLIIHTRDSREDIITYLRTYAAGDVIGVMHCFVEDEATARAALDLGFYISFSGIVTFNNARDLQQVARFVPEDRLLVETDAPWLAPMPYRGKPNVPAYVRFVVAKLAELRGVSEAQIAAATEANFARLFGVTQSAL